MALKWLRRFSSGNTASPASSPRNSIPPRSAPPLPDLNSSSFQYPVPVQEEITCTRRSSAAQTVPLRIPGSARPFSMCSYSCSTTGTSLDSCPSSLSMNGLNMIAGTSVSSDTETQTEVTGRMYSINEMEFYKDQCEQAVTRAQDEIKFVICMHEERGIMFSPCHHVIVCETCEKTLPYQSSVKGTQRLCPLCRVVITKTIKVYLS